MKVINILALIILILLSLLVGSIGCNITQFKNANTIILKPNKFNAQRDNEKKINDRNKELKRALKLNDINKFNKLLNNNPNDPLDKTVNGPADSNFNKSNNIPIVIYKRKYPKLSDNNIDEIKAALPYIIESEQLEAQIILLTNYYRSEKP